jgi:hypothetical protein
MRACTTAPIATATATAPAPVLAPAPATDTATFAPSHLRRSFRCNFRLVMEWCAERELANELLRECAADCNDDEKTARQRTVKKWELIKDGLFDRIAPKYDLVNLVERTYRKRSYGCYVASDGTERRGAGKGKDGDGKVFRGTVHIVQEDTIHGEFFEHFELRAFPFDLQSLSVRVRAREEPTCQTFCFPSHDGYEGRLKSTVHFEGKRMKFSTFSGSDNIMPEWDYVTDDELNVLCHIEKAPPSSTYAKQRHHVFVFNQPVNRRAGYYMCNVVPLYAFLVAFGWNCLADDLVDSANR